MFWTTRVWVLLSQDSIAEPEGLRGFRWGPSKENAQHLVKNIVIELMCIVLDLFVVMLHFATSHNPSII